jgi:hypothetical protein
MESLEREKLIKQYLTAYNEKDVEGMLKPLDELVVFENYSSEKKYIP